MNVLGAVIAAFALVTLAGTLFVVMPMVEQQLDHDDNAPSTPAKGG